MKLSPIAAAVALLIIHMALHASTNEQSPLPVAQSKGRVRGTVMDFNGAVIPSATIIVESESTKRKVISDDDGNFDVELPSGIYRITTELYGFSPFQRAAFRLPPNAETVINVVPVPRSVSYGVVAPRFYYRAFSPPRSFAPLDLLIRFSKQREHKGVIEYTEAMVSYNALTIYASKVCLNPKTFLIKADGNVIVEDGKQRTIAKSAKVQFKVGEPIIELTK